MKGPEMKIQLKEVDGEFEVATPVFDLEEKGDGAEGSFSGYASI